MFAGGVITGTSVSGTIVIVVVCVTAAFPQASVAFHVIVIAYSASAQISIVFASKSLTNTGSVSQLSVTLTSASKLSIIAAGSAVSLMLLQSKVMFAGGEITGDSVSGTIVIVVSLVIA